MYVHSQTCKRENVEIVSWREAEAVTDSRGSGRDRGRDRDRGSGRIAQSTSVRFMMWSSAIVFERTGFGMFAMS